MDSRRLNRKVVLQSATTVQDETGHPVPTWATLAPVWANIRHLSGVETIRAGAQTSAVKVSIRIRYRDDVTASMRVVLGSTTYEIKAVMPDEAGRQFTDLACEVLS